MVARAIGPLHTGNNPFTNHEIQAISSRVTAHFTKAISETVELEVLPETLEVAVPPQVEEEAVPLEVEEEATSEIAVGLAETNRKERILTPRGRSRAAAVVRV